MSPSPSRSCKASVSSSLPPSIPPPRPPPRLPRWLASEGRRHALLGEGGRGGRREGGRGGGSEGGREGGREGGKDGGTCFQEGQEGKIEGEKLAPFLRLKFEPFLVPLQ